jgi:hypothetical protein
MTRAVVGIGLSSQATHAEVARLVRDSLDSAGFTIDDVDAVATRTCFVGDARLDHGPPVVGIDDDDLVAASPPVERPIGLPARVAETAAVIAAGTTREGLRTVRRSAHATVAIAAVAAIDPGTEDET